MLAANYLSVSATPFIVDGFADLFGQTHNNAFPFVFNSIVMAAFTVVVILCRKSFVFAINKTYF